MCGQCHGMVESLSADYCNKLDQLSIFKAISRQISMHGVKSRGLNAEVIGFGCSPKIDVAIWNRICHTRLNRCTHSCNYVQFCNGFACVWCKWVCYAYWICCNFPLIMFDYFSIISSTDHSLVIGVHHGTFYLEQNIAQNSLSDLN